ncbi:MAG: hypothetical protein HY216_06505, partial [Candidatus Rokubacteria bacterium]|nr:hypothetical protein [Candidatus Rokubacteria bacterium]
MSPARDPDEADRDPDLYDEEAPRSIFSAMWFRAVLVVLVLGVIGVVAVPYLLDIVNPPPKATGMKGTQKPTTTDGAGTRPGGTPAPVVSPQSATTSTAATTPPAPATAPAPAATPPTPAPAPSAKATEPA